MSLTRHAHMILEMHDGQILLRPAIHFKHFPKVAKMLYDEVFLVEVRWDAFALYNSGISRRETSQTVCALVSRGASTWSVCLCFRLECYKDK